MLKAFVGAMLILGATRLDGQVILEARQGTTWSDKLTLSQIAPMTFRWRYDGRDTAAPIWQMTFTSPAARGEPTVVRTGSVPTTVSRTSDYSTFQIDDSQVPSNAPSPFWVRLRIGTSYSSWIPITVSSFVIPGGTAPPPPLITAGVANPDPPLWVKLTKIICKAVSSDGNASDEIYVLLGSIALNKEKPWTSAVWTNVTSLYENMNPNDFRSIDKVIWGPPNADPVLLRKPSDAIMFFQMIEHDVGSLQLARSVTLSTVTKAVSTFNPDLSYATMATRARDAFLQGGASVWEGTASLNSGDEQVGPPTFLRFSEDEIESARAGSIVKKELVLGSGSSGVYVIRFQMGRAGTSPEAW